MQARLYKGCAFLVDYTPSGSAISAGQVVVINSTLSFALADIADGALGSLLVPGGEAELEMVKDNSNIADRAALYWDADGSPVGGVALSGAVTSTSSGNTLLGYATAAAGVSAETVRVRTILVPASLTINSDIQSAITDPGNAGAIPVTRSGYCPIVTAGSETRTLAAPTFIGQELLLYIKTDGGTCVITVASAINQTGNNTITMADVRDVIRLVAIESGSSKVWHVVSNDGAALSTV
jgi:predicted RecA/RadA family phage recombinase